MLVAGNGEFLLHSLNWRVCPRGLVEFVSLPAFSCVPARLGSIEAVVNSVRGLNGRGQIGCWRCFGRCV